MTMDKTIGNLVKEATDHEVELWEIACAARDKFGADTPEKVLEVSLEICRRLYERGVRPADSVTGWQYKFWADEGCEAMLARIRREWIALGRGPRIIDEICTFIMPGT